MKTPTLTELDCLTEWPAGTVGEEEDREMIKALLVLCVDYGFDKSAQLAADIETIWRDPGATVGFRKRKKERLRLLDAPKARNTEDYETETDR